MNKIEKKRGTKKGKEKETDGRFIMQYQGKSGRNEPEKIKSRRLGNVYRLGPKTVSTFFSRICIEEAAKFEISGHSYGQREGKVK